MYISSLRMANQEKIICCIVCIMKFILKYLIIDKNIQRTSRYNVLEGSRWVEKQYIYKHVKILQNCVDLHVNLILFCNIY
jgi:hypothetical protein